MARYNTFKYGGAKYGSTTNPNLLWALEIDWDNDGMFTGANEAGRLKSVAITRGRDGYLGPEGLQRMQVGECTLTMDNDDRRFDPWYTSSPLYPNVQPGREVKLRVKNTNSGSTYDIFRGRIEDIPPGERDEKTLVVSDGWRLLNERDATVALRTNATTDLLLGDVLDDVSWPAAWGRSLDTGSDVIPYGWVNSQQAYDAIHDMVESEAGLAYVGAEGKFYFKSRHTLLTAAAALTLNQSQVGQNPELSNPWKTIKNKIAVRAYPRKLGNLGEIWRLDETPDFSPGQSRTIWGTFRDSNYNETIAQDVVAPAATTDYTANTAADGGGTDLTASFSVTATIFAGSVKLVVTNNAAVDGYLTLLKIRGKALELLNVAASISESSTSQATYGKQALTLELPFQQQTSVAVDFSNWLLTWLKDPLPMLVVEMIDQPTIQFAYDLGTYLTFTSSYLGLNHRFRIGKIRHESVGSMQAIRTLWTLEPVDQVTGYWQLGTAGFSELGQTTRLAY